MKKKIALLLALVMILSLLPAMTVSAADLNKVTRVTSFQGAYYHVQSEKGVGKGEEAGYLRIMVERGVTIPAGSRFQLFLVTDDEAITDTRASFVYSIGPDENKGNDSVIANDLGDLKADAALATGSKLPGITGSPFKAAVSGTRIGGDNLGWYLKDVMSVYERTIDWGLYYGGTSSTYTTAQINAAKKFANDAKDEAIANFTPSQDEEDEAEAYADDERDAADGTAAAIKAGTDAVAADKAVGGAGLIAAAGTAALAAATANVDAAAKDAYIKAISDFLVDDGIITSKTIANALATNAYNAGGGAASEAVISAELQTAKYNYAAVDADLVAAEAIDLALAAGLAAKTSKESEIKTAAEKVESDSISDAAIEAYLDKVWDDAKADFIEALAEAEGAIVYDEEYADFLITNYGALTTTAKVYDKAAAKARGIIPEIGYRLEVSTSDNSIATVTLKEDLSSDDQILVPMSLFLGGTSGCQVVVEPGVTDITGGTYLVVDGKSKTSSGNVTLTVNNVKTTRDRFTFDMVLKELKPNSLKVSNNNTEEINKVTVPIEIEKVGDTSISAPTKGSFFKIDLPSGYSWNYSSFALQSNGSIVVSNATKLTLADTNFTGIRADVYAVRSKDSEAGRTLIVFVTGTNTSDLRGLLTFKDLSFSANMTNSKFDTVNIVVSDWSSRMAIGIPGTPVTVKITDRKDYAITFEAKSVSELISGRWAKMNNENTVNVTGIIEISEVIQNSWWTDRETDLTIVGDAADHVKFMGYEIIKDGISGFTGIDNANGIGAKNNDDRNVSAAFKEVNTQNSYYTLNSTMIRFKGLPKEAGKTASLKMRLFLSVDPSYSGEIKLHLGGTAIPDSSAVDDIVIADAIAPVVVETKVTTISNGFQSYKVSDIIITEQIAGAMAKDGAIELSLFDPRKSTATTDLEFLTDAKCKVIEGDLKIKSWKTESGSLSFIVETASKEASTIEITGVEVQTTRSIPYSTYGYNLAVGGSAVIQNLYKYDSSNADKARFGVEYAFDEAFIMVGTPPQDVSGVLLPGTMRIPLGSSIMYVGDTEIQMDVAPYAKNGSLMVPFRFPLEAIGLTDNDFFFVPASGTLTIINRRAANSPVIQLKLGSPYAIMGGVEIPMTDFAGNLISMEAKDGRLFIPIRAVANLLGLVVEYDDVAKEAVFNNPK